MTPKTASIHIDIDSPDTLLRFWGVGREGLGLDRFYERAMTRALSLLKECEIPATFFCVGRELETSAVAATMVKQAFDKGHEIANHTHSHPFALAALSAADIRQEVRDCSAAIRRLTGIPPRGFRAPGYQVNATVLDILEEEGIEYDSSAFWSALHPLMRIYGQARSRSSMPGGFGEASMDLERGPYYPAKEKWTRPGPTRPIVELPLPRTRVLNLPFYSNFHLATGAAYRKTAVALMNQPYFVYLVHLVEFTDLSDGLPAELRVHPNVSTKTAVKVRVLKDTLVHIRRRYRIVTSADAVLDFKASEPPPRGRPPMVSVRRRAVGNASGKRTGDGRSGTTQA